MKWIIRGEHALGEVGWQKKCTVDGGKGILQVERFNQGWKKCGVGERVNQKYAWRKILLDKYYILSCLSIAC